MVGYTKLHSLILDSSVWQEDAGTRLVWITLLAMADQDGVVNASVGGLAHRARVSREECERALEVLAGPDPDSRDGTTGERIEKVVGGWLLLNHANYRERQTSQQAAVAERVRRHREAKKESGALQSVTDDNVTRGNAPETPAASASASASEKKKGARARPRVADRPDDVDEDTWQDWVAHRRTKKAATSATVLKTLRAEGGKAKLSLSQVMALQVANGWQGFRADWLDTKTDKAKKAGRHIPNTPLGSPSCDCDQCIDYRKKRGRERSGSSGVQGIGDVLDGLAQGRAS
jgi:hypothetical protein